MIKFFRQIRFNLMSENKTGKYLKYATGEIVLVVIGILIALSINNWNENRKTYEKERMYLSSLKQDFNETKRDLTRVTDKTESVKKSPIYFFLYRETPWTL